MNKRNLLYAASAVALAAAALVRFWLAPFLTQLPADYSSTLLYNAESHFRATTEAEWETFDLVSRRVDQTLTTPAGAAIIHGMLYRTVRSGRVIFEASELYGVDRTTRQNLPGYGDAPRTGQYLFPQHMQPATYAYWDQHFIGPRQAIFSERTILDGLEVYVYKFSGADLDETAGYAQLTDVPERYSAHTDGAGVLWIEPLSGVVVDYEETGTSYFVDPATGVRLADFHRWRSRFTPETAAVQMQLAHAARRQLLLLESWLPGALLALGAGCLVAALALHRRQAPAAAAWQPVPGRP